LQRKKFSVVQTVRNVAQQYENDSGAVAFYKIASDFKSKPCEEKQTTPLY
jgi:hypothetical protein